MWVYFNVVSSILPLVLTLRCRFFGLTPLVLRVTRSQTPRRTIYVVRSCFTGLQIFSLP